MYSTKIYLMKNFYYSIALFFIASILFTACRTTKKLSITVNTLSREVDSLNLKVNELNLTSLEMYKDLNEQIRIQNDINTALFMTLAPSDFANEYDLDITPHILDRATLTSESNEFIANFKGINRANFTSKEETVNYSELYSKIFKGQTGTAGAYISGLRIFYTLTSNNKLKYYYVVTKSDAADLTTDPIEFEFYRPENNDIEDLNQIFARNAKVYELSDGGNLLECNTSSLKTKAILNYNRYLAFVTISETGVGVFRNISVNDGISAYFPFKCIEDLATTNNAQQITFVSTTNNLNKHNICGYAASTTTNGINHNIICPAMCGKIRVSGRRVQQ